WFSGWRPAFLGGETKPASDKPAGDTKPDVKPGEPGQPPPATEIGKNCFAGTTEVKVGAGACGFALDATGAVSFQGARIAERLAAGTGPAQRLVLYPFAPSSRFVFLRACDGGGKCDVQRLVDTKEKKIFEVKVGGEGFG